ncbi:hypothetical protein [Marinoscillum pacificum]|uniref:hypothetical protein n=1 Tax=Marinoscillum pacificum TaxID=392723 RepID=UPI0021572EF2|nr:hypothetical protein [Marinoscillum pacificum]
MREIEGIEHAVEILKPHMAEIDEHFNTENEKFKELFSRDHDDIGRILKCHLIVEHYVNQFLISHYSFGDLGKLRLSFSQKANMLPSEANAVAFIKPGVLRLNKIRNQFSHDLNTNIFGLDLGAMNEIVDSIRPKITFEHPTDKVEAFTTIACTWMIIPPKNLQDVFMEAFSNIRPNKDL